ncbi:MAG: SDR family NAD(P)-dependent oxidoreductase [Anaerolineae bacterium]|nr:SDR family NAD(P)-dependent oxidoreductase [Anaerolineae bacterium]
MKKRLFKLADEPDAAPIPPTLVDLLQWRAQSQPNWRAYTFLLDGEVEEAHLTYQELDQQARAIGGWLQSLNIAGERVLILYPPGLEYVAAFFGCLYGGNIAVPAYPPRLNRPSPRLQAIVADAQPVVALTTPSIFSSLERRFAHTPELKALRWLTFDDLPGGAAADWQPPITTPDSLASLQYTSGSTGSPKGVMVSHGNFMRNLNLIRHAFAIGPEDRGVFWLPLYHDMGLGSILEPMYIGAYATIMSPLAFLQRPVRWLQAISRYRATISGAPNFAYNLCVDKITPDQRETLDLSSWQLAFCGAEPVRQTTLERFVAAFEPYGFRREAFYPCYGLAEATLIVSGELGPERPVVRTVHQTALEQNQAVEASPAETAALSLVSCGQTLLDQKIVIVHPKTMTLCPPHQVGEIWVSGSSVTQGYWRQVEETRQTFQAYLADTGEGPFLRTGDLGFLHEGRLFVTGRLKDLIIIRGRNYYPQDIELTVEQSHPALQPGSGAAFSVESAGEERLVIVYEVKRRHRQPNVVEVVGAIRQAVADHHSLPVYAITLIQTLSLPKTSSGKIKRHACRADFLAGKLQVIGEWQAAITSPEMSETPGVTVDTPAPGAQIESHSMAEIQAWLIARISERSNINPAEIDPRQPFVYYGLDSVQAVSLSGDLERWLDCPLSPTLLYDYPTVETLVRHLGAAILRREIEVLELPAPTVSSPESENHKAEPIAIIGLACRFPGAKDADAFWQLLCDGVDAITEVPADRWRLDDFYHPDPATAGTMNTRWGGFLANVDQFDARFFGISPREASRMDPQQRLLLELAWEALEDAGQVPNRLVDTDTGVFIGISSNEYGQYQLNDLGAIDAYAGTGNALSIAANRISYIFGFQGPSMAVDTACSSSLVAVHLACQSLWHGEASLALAGGVNLILSPAVTINFTKAGLMAPDGRCKTFDARADGYVRGEGAGLVVLKSLSRALADNDPIYAVIRGSAVNQDGRTNGLMAPSRQAQEAVLRAAYQRSGVSPAHIQYVETHGTGTLLGDTIEAQALGAILAPDRDPQAPCAIGSVKTNIGHLEAAAGIAGLIKVTLSLKHRLLPPSLHFEEPNPHVAFDDLLLRVQQNLTGWPDHVGPALAGVSSFGFGGTNAHVVLAEGPPKNSPDEHGPEKRSLTDRQSAYLLPLSAHSLEALQAQATIYPDFLKNTLSQNPEALPDICYTASVRRQHHPYRLAVVGQSATELAARLEAFLRSKPPSEVSSRTSPQPRPLVFVFPGQGGQWLGMGQELLVREPVFRTTLTQCDQAMHPYLDWSLLDELTVAEETSQFGQIDVIQPLLFAIQIALAQLWRSWGLEPAVVVGHSMGEVAAAYVAGALSLTDAARVICLRSQLLRRVSGQGTMLAVELSVEQAREYLAGYEDRVAIAVSNSPRATVLSGDASALAEIGAILESRGIFQRPVQVDVASHSPQMDLLRDDLCQALVGIQPKAASISIYSTVTGQASNGLELTADYWVRNLREPVLFSAAIQGLLGKDYDTFLEISPHPILSSAIREGLAYAGRPGMVLPSMRRGVEVAVMLESLGTLYTLGQPVDWPQLYSTGGRCVHLPAYPWQRERFWLEPDESPQVEVSSRTGRRLLGRHQTSAIDPGTHFWETTLGLEQSPYLAGHQVQGKVLLPAAAYIAMSLTAVKKAFGADCAILEQVKFREPLFLLAHEPKTGQLVITAETPGTASWQFFSLDDSPKTSWTSHVSGSIRFNQTDPPGPIQLGEIQARSQNVITGTEFYRAVQQWGFAYGPDFQIIHQIWRRDGEAVGQIRLAGQMMPTTDEGSLTIIIDACFQVLMATLPDTDDRAAEGETYVVAGLDRLQTYGRFPAEAELWGYALLQPEAASMPGIVKGDVSLVDANGQVWLSVEGLTIQRLGADRRAGLVNLDEWLYQIQWQPSKLEREDTASSTGAWLIFADDSGVGQVLSTLLAGQGETCITVTPGSTYAAGGPGHYHIDPTRPEDFQQLLVDVRAGNDQPPLRGIVHLWSLDLAPPDIAPDTAQALGWESVLSLVQALAHFDWPDPPQLWLVTRGVQAIGPDVTAVSTSQAPLWGLGRVIAHEHPEFRCANVDLAPVPAPQEIEPLFQELYATGREDQIAWRNDQRYVARLVRYAPSPVPVESPELASSHQPATQLPLDDAFRLELDTPGILADLKLRPSRRRSPGRGEVEIQVYAAGLNFLDVLAAMGARPDAPAATPLELGGECAGKIVAVGEGVEGPQIGDEVMAVAPSSFGSFVTTTASFVVPKSAHLSFEEAATIPIAFSTAYYALRRLGHLAEGERVCIHSAAGGVGLAAVQLAQQVGAEIFATAGTPEKREFLRSLGIQHVLDSRTLAFAEEVMAETGGQGVDVVLNSLAGEAMARSLTVLAPYGRFLEIGKRDIYQNSRLGLGPFQKNLSYFAIDLARLMRERPAQFSSLLHEVGRQVAAGVLKPLPRQTFPISQATSAFRLMAQAKHIGKIVLSMQDEAVSVAWPGGAGPQFRPDGAYLITGGLGGLGLTVGQWLVQQGARYLVLVGRRGAAAAVQETLTSLRKQGVTIEVIQADVSRPEQVDAVLKKIKRTLPPLRGIIHAAGLLDDGILLHQDQARFKRVMAPKIDGAWNLHRLTIDESLDFFVLFSSAASLLGTPGQGNYAAANAFMDALAHQRRAQGLPALSINWSIWSGVGLAARPSNEPQQPAMPGVDLITPWQGLDLLGRLLRQNTAQVGVLPFNLSEGVRYNSTIIHSPLLSALRGTPTDLIPPSGSPIRQNLVAAPIEQRRGLLETYLREQVAQVVWLPPAQVDPHMPLSNLGVDSLMALELRRRLERDLHLTLSATLIWNYPSIADLIPYLVGQMGIPVEDNGPDLPVAAEPQPEQLEFLDKLEQISEEEAEALLAARLERLSKKQ